MLNAQLRMSYVFRFTGSFQYCEKEVNFLIWDWVFKNDKQPLLLRNFEKILCFRPQNLLLYEAQKLVFQVELFVVL